MVAGDVKSPNRNKTSAKKQQSGSGNRSGGLWEVYSKMKVIKSLSKNKMKIAQKLPISQFGAELYIETLFSKWHLCDDLNWILEY